MYVSNAGFIVPCFLLHVSLVFLSPAPPPAPVITFFSFTAGVSFTVEWSETPGSCETVDGFTFNITPNDLSCTRSTMTTVTCSYNRTHLGQMYTFSVAALNCDIQSGDEATITINLQGIAYKKCTNLKLTKKTLPTFQWNVSVMICVKVKKCEHNGN